MPLLSEFHTRYSLFLKPDYVQMEAIDFLTGKEKLPPKSWQELGEVTDPSACLSLLTQAVITAHKDYSRVGRRRDAGLLEALRRLEQHYIRQYDDFMSPLCLNPVIPDISMFPEGSWALSFKFRLKKPYISKDDSDFYIIDNPIRKEWVFKLPYIAASQWKGALRAAMVKKLVDEAESLSDKKFAEKRFHLSLLFGDEKGGDDGELTGLAEYLDNVKLSYIIWDEIPRNDKGKFIEFLNENFYINWISSATIAKREDGKTLEFSYEKHSLTMRLDNDMNKAVLTIDNKKTHEFLVKKENEKVCLLIPYAGCRYRKKIRQFFRQCSPIKDEYPIPKHAGWLHCYPTYFTNIGLEVINPHDRETGAGAQPIYFECVPTGAKGELMLLYVPLYCKREDGKEIEIQENNYLRFFIEGLKAMMTQYGFGAKTSNGFGVAENNIEKGNLILNAKGIETSIHNKKSEHEIPEEFSKYLIEDGTVKKELCTSDGKLLSTDQFVKSDLKGEISLKKFRNFRRWYNDYIKKNKNIHYINLTDGLHRVEFDDFDQLLRHVDILLQNIKGSEDSNC
jgi:CRISPR/Cas system CMR subunit Cmr6 (Cas7 group RAMP superfamily)